MKFHKLDEIPLRRDDQVFKVSPTGKAIVAFIMFGASITFLVLAIRGVKPHGATPGAFYFFAVVLGLFGLIPYKMFRNSLRPSSWLIRCTAEGIFVKYRSYLNWRLPADAEQVVAFDYAEIAWAKLVKETRSTPSERGRGGGSTTSFLTYIDLGLANPATADLEKRLQAERNLRPDGMALSLDYPVQVLPGGIVEISWGEGITPSARKAIEFLGRRVKTIEPEHRKTDLTHNRKASPADEQAKILTLAKSGDKLTAIHLARQVYGYSETEAYNFVEKLLGQED